MTINWNLFTGASNARHSEEQADLVRARAAANKRKADLEKRAIAKRQAIETRIMRRVITDAIAAGYFLSVNDGSGFTLCQSQDENAIMIALRTTDEDMLVFFRPVNTPYIGTVERAGHVYFVYGNDGYDVICDHSVSLTDVLKGATELADSLAE